MAPLRPRLVGPARAAVVLAVLTVAFFWRLWALAPADRMMIGGPGSDFIRQFYPYRAFVASALASGSLPLWNPHQYAGTPALADPQLGVLYPMRLVQAPLAIGGRRLPLAAVELEVVVHLFLAGWFVYLLLRRLSAVHWAALLSALTYAFGGYLTGYPVQQLAVLESAAWIPAVLWALTAATEPGRRESLVGVAPAGDDAGSRGSPRVGNTPMAGGSPARRAPAQRIVSRLVYSVARPSMSPVRWVLVAAIATALTALAGHPQTAMYGVWVGGAWLGWRIAGRSTQRVRAAGLGALWLAAAAGLSAAQWWPSLSLLRHAAPRFGRDELLAGFPPGDVLQALAPGVISQWSPLYVGIVPLLLVAWGVWAVRATRFWVGMAFFAWLIALGGNGPVFPILLRVVPATGLFRHQERLAVVVSLSLAVAAGLALSGLVSGAAKKDREPALLAAALATGAFGFAAVGIVRPGAVAAVVGWLGVALPAEGGPAALSDALAFTGLMAAAAAVALALHQRGRLSAAGLGLMLALILALDMFSVNSGQALAPRQPVFDEDAIVRALAPHARDGRVSSEALLPGGPNAASVFGLFDVTGDSPVQLEWMHSLVQDLPELAWWRLLGVRYVVTDREFPSAAPVAPLARSDNATLYEVQLPVPPAWVATQVERVGPNWVPGPDFDPRQKVILPRQAGATAGAGAAEPPAGAGGSVPDAAALASRESAAGAARAPGAAARLTGMSTGHAEVVATLPHSGYVVLAVGYDPGWRVQATSESGTSVRPSVQRAYTALAAVALPAGEWVVEWTYLPNAVIFGLALSALTMVTGAALWRRFGMRKEAR